MKKILKTMLLVFFVISLISIPVSAKTTYYLPSKGIEKFYDYGEYDGDRKHYYYYDEYGHLMFRTFTIFKNSKETLIKSPQRWEFTYNKQGIRVSAGKKTFDKYGRATTYTSWNSKGYLSKTRNTNLIYKYNKNGLPLKITYKVNGETTRYEIFNSDGLIKKRVVKNKVNPEEGDIVYTYSYKKDKNGIVKIKKENRGPEETHVYEYIYSDLDVKTDEKTYKLFISGYEGCERNANM